MRIPLLALLSLASACAPKVAPPPPAEAAVPALAPVPSLSPVHFSSGSKNIAGGDAPLLESALAYLRDDPTLAVTLLGYTDTDGDESANRALAAARGEFVRNFLVSGGVDPSRITVVGQGEVGATGDATHDRRVDFAFSRRVPPAGPSQPAAAPAEPAASEELAEKPAKTKKEKGGGEARERQAMKPVGIADLDLFFGKVQAILDRVYATEDALISARSDVQALVGIAGGATLDAALGEALKTAEGSLAFSLAGGKPSVTVKNNPSPEVRATADAVNGLLGACGTIAAELPRLLTDAMALVEEAKAIPPKVPTMAKEVGASPMELPKMIGAAKSNVGATIAMPGEIKGLIDEGALIVSTVRSALGGG